MNWIEVVAVAAGALALRELAVMMADRHDRRPACAECGLRRPDGVQVTWGCRDSDAGFSLEGRWWLCARHARNSDVIERQLAELADRITAARAPKESTDGP